MLEQQIHFGLGSLNGVLVEYGWNWFVRVRRIEESGLKLSSSDDLIN